MAPQWGFRESPPPRRGGASGSWDSQEFHEKGNGASEVHEEWTEILGPDPELTQSLTTAMLVSLEATVLFLVGLFFPRRNSNGHSRCVAGAATHHRYLVSLRWNWVLCLQLVTSSNTSLSFPSALSAISLIGSQQRHLQPCSLQGWPSILHTLPPGFSAHHVVWPWRSELDRDSLSWTSGNGKFSVCLRHN